ncbi:MAG TPA: M3 family oligoendopeptidase [Candidatus Ozemobacteraceae bacterium]|nr:M3 family oligoendopeptidase [Candidatus Ozemobacteraceae bacterium]
MKTKKTASPTNSAAGVCWNLADLYASPSDPRIERDLKQAEKRATAFEKSWKGALKRGLTGAKLAEAVREYEEILVLRDRPAIYANLLFSGDTQNPAYGRLMQSVQERATGIHTHLLFFMLEWCALDEKTAAALIGHKAVARWRHFLEAARRYRPHVLSEPEERIVEELENTGSRAFVRLFDETLGAMKFPVKTGGKSRELTEQEALAMLYDPDRDVRRAAAEGLTEGFEANLRPLTFMFNTLVQDHATIDRLRSYPHPMASRNLSNEIDAKTVDTLLRICDENTGMVGRYYRLKARLLGLKKLFDYDRYAPVSREMPGCTWDECRELVVSTYRAFSPKAGLIAETFFAKRWIDAELRAGKRGGAFSAPGTPDAHPYILVNYSERLRDVSTVAHELGHGIHQYLSQERGYIQSDTPLTLAETASVFGEMLVFQELLERQKKPEVKLALLCGKIEDAFATVFRQVCMTRFEQKLHAARREGGELTADQMSDLWLEANRSMFGDSVELTPGYRRWWCYITHFIHSPFYCYAYAFGELLVLSLYALYRKQGSAFVPKYMELLAAGGSESPEELTKRLGIDITKPAFWKAGIGLLSEMVDEAERLAAALPKKKTPTRR